MLAGVTGTGAHTLVVDCGGTGLKAAVLDAEGRMLTDRVRIRTPYPCPPDVLTQTLTALVAMLPAYHRVSVGFPGMIRKGCVLATPHYVTEAGPFTPARPDLVAAWAGYHVAVALEEAFGRPTRVVNDAEMAGFAVVEGKGFEVVLTLGTGLGCALFDDGRLLPKVEMSQAPFRKGQSYDEQLGDHARRCLGNSRWGRRVARALDALRPVLWWDRLYLGGGNARYLDAGALGQQVMIVPNEAGLLGGVRLWER
jgi:polyphosphate glucokinase